MKEVLLPWSIYFLMKISKAVVLKRKLHKISKLAEELHEQLIRKFLKRKVFSSFKDNIWGADLADLTDYNTKVNEIDEKITDHNHDNCIFII